MEDTKSETPADTAAKSEDPATGARVPPEGERFEHQLKRLIVERNAARTGRPGFYR